MSVVLPVYNGLAFLEEAVESVLRQTFTDFELLAIDDASTDRSVERLRAWADPRVRVVVNERNLGQSATMNRGITLARGRYVARMDQDDVCLPRRLERQVAFLEANPSVVVSGTWGTHMDVNGRSITSTRRRVLDFGDFLGGLVMGECPLWHPTVTFRRDVIRDAGAYDAAFGPAEDYELWTRLALRRETGYVVPEVLLRYRLHEAQQTATKAAVQQRAIARAQEALIAAFCPREAAGAVAALLRIDRALWARGGSRPGLRAVLAAVQLAFEAMRTRFAMSTAEWRSFGATIARRLGHAVRPGASLACWPVWAVYPAFFVLSPILVPGVRTIGAPVLRWVRRIPYELGMPDTGARR